MRRPELSNEFEGFALHRLDSGRLAAVWKVEASGVATQNITTLDALGVTHSAILANDLAATSRTLSLPSIASTALGGFFIAWEDDATAVTALAGDTYGRAYDAAGAALTSEFALSGATAGGEYTPTVARLGNGNFLVTWSDTLSAPAFPPASETMGRIYTAAGVAAGAEFQINTTTAGVQLGTDTVALGDGRTVVGWGTSVVSGFSLVSTELRGRFIGRDGVATGADFQIDTIASGSTYQDESFEMLALGTGDFVAVWEEETSAPIEEIHFQRMSAAGAKLGAEFVVASVSGNDHITQMITTDLANGGFAVAWRVFNATVNAGTSHVRVFDYAGTEIGADTSLNMVGAPGLNITLDLELMSNGQVMALGFNGASIATQVFDFGDERMIGTVLADTLYGKNGLNDKIDGGAGNNSLVMSSTQLTAAADLLDGGADNDTADFSQFVAAVSVDLTVTAAEAKTSDTANAWTTATRTIADFVSIENITGSAFSDKLVGDAGANVLTGGAGDDILDGGAGIDTYVGGLGNDAYYVRHLGVDGRVQDNFIELANQGTDGVNTSVSLNLNEARYANIENGYIVGTAATNLGGSAVNNVLVGNSAANSLYGLGGRDVMRGEGGVDTFVYISNADTGKTVATRDLIQDFTSGTDKLDVFLMDANGALAGNGTFVFLATQGAAFTNVAGQLHYVWEDNVNNALDKTIIEGDFNGDSLADFQIELTGLKTLLVTDFVL